MPPTYCYSGGVIAYPTEGVYGLGCLPDEDAAVERVLRLKQREAGKGLILIAAEPRISSMAGSTARRATLTTGT